MAVLPIVTRYTKTAVKDFYIISLMQLEKIADMRFSNGHKPINAEWRKTA